MQEQPGLTQRLIDNSRKAHTRSNSLLLTKARRGLPVCRRLEAASSLPSAIGR